MSNISSLTVAGTTFDIKDNVSGYVKGTGTDTYLAKWTGSSTISNGPKITSGNTSYFLREDGNWRYPQTLGDSYPPSYTLVMQNDGNLVLYDQTEGTAIWNTSDTLTRWSHEDQDPQRLYTTSAATTVSSNTTTWTSVQDFTVNYSGWHLVTLMQYVNISPSSGRIGMRVTDGDNRAHTAWLASGAANGGSIALNFIGYFAKNTTYHVSAYNSTNVNWAINRDLSNSELMVQYLHRNT